MQAVYEYRAQFVQIHPDSVIELLVDLGFRISAQIKLRLYGVKLPSTTSPDVDERARAVRAFDFMRATLGDTSLHLRARRNAKDVAKMFGAEVLYADDLGKEQSIGEQLIRAHLAERAE